jgi:hypothetical protein
MSCDIAEMEQGEDVTVVESEGIRVLVLNVQLPPSDTAQCD